MKKLIIANCILAIAVIFSFCAKPDLKEELSDVNTTDAASNRGTCTVTQVGVTNDAVLSICGTNTNAFNCNDCGGAGATGFVATPAWSLNLTLTTPIVFSVRADKATAVDLSAGGGNSTGTVSIPAGGCRRFRITDNCIISVLP